MNQEILKSIKAPAGRCWYTCILYLKKIKKVERKDYKFIEGRADGDIHYWLEKEGEIIDPHYEIIDVDVQKYKKEKEYEAEYILSRVDKSYYEEKEYNTLEGGRAKRESGYPLWMKVYHINI